MKKLVFALWLLGACHHQAPPEPVVPQYSMSGVLIPTEQITRKPFVVQQHLKGSYLGTDVTVDCVVQWKDKKLTVLGLTPFGTRAFTIEQTGVDVKFQKFVDRDLPIQAEMVLYDIHRVFFRGLPPEESTGQDHSDQVTELRSADYVIERRFVSMDGPTNMVVVSFDGPPAPVIAPHVRVTNTRYNYSVEIDNTEQKSLDSELTVEVTGPSEATPTN